MGFSLQFLNLQIADNRIYIEHTEATTPSMPWDDKGFVQGIIPAYLAKAGPSKRVLAILIVCNLCQEPLFVSGSWKRISCLCPVKEGMISWKKQQQKAFLFVCRTVLRNSIFPQTHQWKPHAEYLPTSHVCVRTAGFCEVIFQGRLPQTSPLYPFFCRIKARTGFRHTETDAAKPRR